MKGLDYTLISDFLVKHDLMDKKDASCNVDYALDLLALSETMYVDGQFHALNPLQLEEDK